MRTTLDHPLGKLALACLATLLMAAGPARAAEKDPPLKIIQVRGDGPEMGRQYGQQLAEPIRFLHDAYMRTWFKDDALHKQALLGALAFRIQLLPDHRAELTALAEASGIDSGDAMLANCFLDLTPMEFCSTIALPAAAAPDRVARFGRNLDFPTLGIADKYSVIVVYHPKGRYAFASVTWPGLIGVLSGMNEHGLTLANMEVPRPQRPPLAMPYTLLYRSTLERCKTVDEAIDYLKTTPRQTANNLMLMDADGNRAVVEITPKDIAVRRAPPDAALISTNHHRGQDQDKPGLCQRYDSLRNAAKSQAGRIDLPSIERMLGNVAQGNMTLQSMVFEPATRTLYLATGTEATKHEYRKVELKPYFQEQ